MMRLFKRTLIIAAVLVLFPLASSLADEGLDSQNKKEEGVQSISIMFTYWERKAISNAISQRGINIANIDTNFEDLDGSDLTEPPPPEPGERELRLSGIVYVDSGNWIVWLNETEIRPGTIPEQAIAMKVSEDFIDIQWFDEYTNQIFPVRLRVGQRFNLDMRTFLPGSDEGGAPIPVVVNESLQY